MVSGGKTAHRSRRSGRRGGPATPARERETKRGGAKGEGERGQKEKEGMGEWGEDRSWRPGGLRTQKSPTLITSCRYYAIDGRSELGQNGYW